MSKRYNIIEAVVICLFLIVVGWICFDASVELPQVPTINDAVANPENWHKIVLDGVRYVVYTGPGEVVSSEVLVSVEEK